MGAASFRIYFDDELTILAKVYCEILMYNFKTTKKKNETSMYFELCYWLWEALMELSMSNILDAGHYR